MNEVDLVLSYGSSKLRSPRKHVDTRTGDDDTNDDGLKEILRSRTTSIPRRSQPKQQQCGHTRAIKRHTVKACTVPTMLACIDRQMAPRADTDDPRGVSYGQEKNVKKDELDLSQLRCTESGWSFHALACEDCVHHCMTHIMWRGYLSNAIGVQFRKESEHSQTLRAKTCTHTKTETSKTPSTRSNVMYAKISGDDEPLHQNLLRCTEFPRSLLNTYNKHHGR